jgi:Domain of unknown function (DUF4159)
MPMFTKISAATIACILAGIVSTQAQKEIGSHDTLGHHPDAEFQLARVKYATQGGGGSHGYFQPWWAIDYPLAEEHFFPALRRTTNVQVADDERHLELTDDRIFQYPFLFLQQPGRGNWRPTAEDAARLREFCNRGGFLLVDDFHGERDWAIFEAAITRVFPDRQILEIPDDDPLMHVFFDLDKSVGIPGDRHLRGGVVRMQGPPHWLGIYNDHNQLMVAMNFNSDMGDGWEHADDPEYPVPFTALAYKFGINYVIYAMTH